MVHVYEGPSKTARFDRDLSGKLTEDCGDPVDEVDDHQAFGGAVHETEQQAARVVPVETRAQSVSIALHRVAF